MMLFVTSSVQSAVNILGAVGQREVETLEALELLERFLWTLVLVRSCM